MSLARIDQGSGGRNAPRQDRPRSGRRGPRGREWTPRDRALLETRSGDGERVSRMQAVERASETTHAPAEPEAPRSAGVRGTSVHADPRAIRQCRTFAFAGGVACAAIGALAITARALAGWPGLGRLSWIAADAGAGFVAAGASLLLLCSRRRALRTCGRALAGLLAVGASALVALRLLGLEPGGQRMPPATAMALALAGLALSGLDATRARFRLAEAFALASSFGGLLAVLGHTFDAAPLGDVGAWTHMSLPSAALVYWLGLAILAARPRRGSLRALLADSPGGVAGRRLLPAALLVPVVLGWAKRAGEAHGLFDADTGTALLVAAHVVAFATLVLANAFSLHRAHLVRVRADRERERLLARAQESVRARDEFLSIASHELRTPIATLQLQCHSLRAQAARDGVPVGALLSRVDRMARQTARLHRIVDGLLDVPRLLGGPVSLQLEDVDLAAVAADAVEAAHDDLVRSGSELRLRAGTAVVGRWDRLRLEQVATNLVVNAAKYGRGRPIDVDVSSRQGVARLSVRDRGIGIAPEDHQRIFGRFERAVSERHFGGLGIGLWVSQRHVLAMEGTIAVESRPGEGATFTVELPVDG